MTVSWSATIHQTDVVKQRFPLQIIQITVITNISLGTGYAAYCKLKDLLLQNQAYTWEWLIRFWGILEFKFLTSIL